MADPAESCHAQHQAGSAFSTRRLQLTLNHPLPHCHSVCGPAELTPACLQPLGMPTHWAASGWGMMARCQKDKLLVDRIALLRFRGCHPATLSVQTSKLIKECLAFYTLGERKHTVVSGQQRGHGDSVRVVLGTCSRQCLELASNYFKRVGDLDPKFYFAP